MPFNVTIPDKEQDKELIEKLKGELSGILKWIVQGCLEWQNGGLQTPDEVKAATNDYRNEMDEIGIFLTECCILNPNVKTNPTNLYDAYKKWCEKTGETVYVGRTKDLNVRKTQHARHPEMGKYEFEIDKRTNDYAAQRGREQQLYDEFKPRLNKIRPISPRNRNLPEYMKAANELER